MDAAAADCFETAHYDWVAINAWDNIGVVDPNVCASLSNAEAAGLPIRDIYMIPCPTCTAPPRVQMDTMISYVVQNCRTAWTGGLWLYIEDPASWTSGITENETFYTKLVDSCSSRWGVTCGIYSSYDTWVTVFGTANGFCFGQQLPLWYSSPNLQTNYDDFQPFGCWTEPYGKQYVNDVYECSMPIDRNYKP